jgi:hypothetical protein
MRKRKERVSEEKRLLFFWAFFSRRETAFQRQRRAEQTEFEPIFFLQNKKELFFCLGADEPPLRTRKMQKEEFTTRTTRGQRENIY